MKKPSSRGKKQTNASQCNDLQVRTEQRAIALLPKAYPFDLSDKFRTAFTQQAEHPLPALYNLAYWEMTVGNAAWDKELAETKAANQKIMADYEASVAKVDKQNRLISESNHVATKEYERQLKEYQLEVAGHPQRQLRHEESLQSKAISLRINALHEAIDSQEEMVAAAIEDAWRIATEVWERRTLVARLAAPSKRREILASVLTNYGHLDYGEKGIREKYCFFLSSVSYINNVAHLDWAKNYGDRPVVIVHSPVYIEVWDTKSKEERNPFGKYKPSDFSGAMSLRDAFLNEVSVSEIQSRRKKVLTGILTNFFGNDLMGCRRDTLIEEYKNQLPSRVLQPPYEPIKPILQELMSAPPQPTLRIPKKPQPPPECIDTAEEGLVEHVFKGSQVYGIEQVMTLARSRLFADDQVRPHFTLGGVPFPIVGNSPHMLVVGTSGSGKTTTLLRLMSSLLPLSTAQATRLAKRVSRKGTVYPESFHQWGRSQTHQAVVYNAKGEYVQYLEAFGFDSEVDLFNLDPTDPNGYAWDVAADIDSRESIKLFAEQLIPENMSATKNESEDFWNGVARDMVEAIIVSLTNAAHHAGQKPSWTLRDLVKIARNDDFIKQILLWHDTPLEAVQEFFGGELSGQQKSSAVITLRRLMRKYDLVAERWYHAKKCGRAISLKKWSLEGAHSVLVLPDTKKNVSTYGPLNKAVMKALGNIWLTDRYSFYLDDDGKKQKRHRFLIIDEVGEAGQFDELPRILGQGRTFGIHVVLGLHQLSQVRKAYGEEDAETIIGHCHYRAFLKNGDVRTQEWMSKSIGNCLRSYEKKVYSYSTNNGITLTEQTTEGQGGGEGTNESIANSKMKGTADTTNSTEAHAKSKQKSHTSAARAGDRGTSTSGDSESDTNTKGQSHTKNESTTDTTTTAKNKQTNWQRSKSLSEAVNRSENEGVSTQNELRGEAAIEPYEFGHFADPETTGRCEVAIITPTLPVFRTTLQMADVQPEYEYPEKKGKTSIIRSEEEDKRVSRPTAWTNEDLERLCLDKPHTLPDIPHMQILPSARPKAKQIASNEDEQPLLEDLDYDDEPPAANFDF